MRYAISYVSTIEQNISHVQLKTLLQESTDHNNSEDITGLLLCSEGNFFELIVLVSRINQKNEGKAIIKSSSHFLFFKAF